MNTVLLNTKLEIKALHTKCCTKKLNIDLFSDFCFFTFNKHLKNVQIDLNIKLFFFGQIRNNLSSALSNENRAVSLEPFRNVINDTAEHKNCQMLH